MHSEILKSPKWSLLAQAVIFVVVFGVFFAIEARSDSEARFFESLFAYVTWVPAMWDGMPGGFLSYVLLTLVALASLAASSRSTLRAWSLLLFNISAFLWTLFPCLTYHLGDYRGP